MSEAQYVDLSEVQNIAEELGPEALESQDYSDFEITPVGNYISQSREIKAKEKVGKSGKYFSFEISFSGLDDPKTGRRFVRPDRTWVTTIRFQRPNRPGSTSGVAEYLRACGLDPKEGNINEQLEVSKTLPVQVYVAWEDQGKNVGTKENPKWVQKGLKTKDFNVGTKDEPRYVPSVTINGETFTARPRVSSFSKVPA